MDRKRCPLYNAKTRKLWPSSLNNNPTFKGPEKQNLSWQFQGKKLGGIHFPLKIATFSEFAYNTLLILFSMPMSVLKMSC